LDKLIKLIWDFRGPTAGMVAQHHKSHLDEFILKEEIDPKITGHKDFSNTHSIAYMVVKEADMISVRDSLKPHRGEIYENSSGIP